jgi:hypothetical protein
LKQPLALAACLIALVVSAKAQPLLLPPPAYAHVPMAALPPHEIAASMRSVGLRPLHRPVRQGRIYVVRAINPAGEEVGAVVDARSGRILRINPMLIPPNALPVMPAPYGGPPGRMIAFPDGADMSGLLAEPPPPGVPGSSASMPRAAAGTASPAQVGAPPLPRPRPKVAATQAPARAAIDAQPPTPAAAPPVAAPAQPSAPPIASGQSKAGEGSATTQRTPEAKNPGSVGTHAVSSAAATPVEEQE